MALKDEHRRRRLMEGEGEARWMTLDVVSRQRSHEPGMQVDSAGAARLPALKWPAKPKLPRELIIQAHIPHGRKYI